MKHRFILLMTALLLLAAFVLPAAAGQVSVLTVEREKKVLANGAENALVDFYYKNALVKIDGNPGAEEKINAELRDLEEDAAEEWEKRGEEQIQFWYDSLEKGTEWQSWFITEIRKELTPERIDDRVISFKVLDYEYTGGAHGMYAVTGLNFDAETGTLLTLADLADSPAGLREVCVREIMRQCQSAEGLWWYDEPSLRPAAETIADRDSWYLTEEGIVFHSIPYEIGPYAIGAVEFTVPYDLLPELKYR